MSSKIRTMKGRERIEGKRGREGKERKLGEGLLPSAGVESVREAEDRTSLLLESFQMSSDRTPDSSQSPKGHISLRPAGGGLP